MPGWRNIRVFLKTAKRKIKNFLLSDKSREFLIFLFFLFIASGFWLLQTLNDDYQATYTLPVRLRDVPNDVVLTSEPPASVKVTLKDKGTVLLNYMLGQSFYPINLDFPDYSERGNHVRIMSRELDKKINSQLISSTSIVSIKPDTLDFVYTQGQSKKLRVKLHGTFTPARQYYITDTIISPDTVTVYAPANILDTMKFAHTNVMTLEDVSDTIQQLATFKRIKGVKYIPNSVEVTFPVDIITEKTIEVSVIPVNFPPDKVLRTFPSRVQITFQVGLNHFKSINPEAFVLTAPYEDLINNPTEKFKLRLKSIPAGISHVRINPEDIDYLIEQIPVNDN